MNIRGGSKDRIDIKRRTLDLELEKPEEEQNKHKIKRLKQSIKRNKNISKKICQVRKLRKKYEKQEKS